jgi:DNA polymerase-3 subunit beta
MNIECIKEKLAYALGKAERITGKNVTLPILNCLLLEAKNSLLTIKATNLDIGIEISIPVKVITEGSIAVSGSVLNNFVSHISNDKNITLEVVDGNLKIVTKHSESTIKAYPIDDFPNIPHITDEKTFTLNISEFIKGLKSVMYSSSTSTIRPVLSSVLVYPDAEEIVCVATDSFRLAEKRVRVKKHKDFNQILIPFKHIPDIIRSFEDVKDDVLVYLNANQLSLSYGDIYVTSRVIDGTFPDYKQIIPKDIKTEITVLKQDIVNALKISNIFSDKFSQVTFEIDVSKKLFQIKTKNMDIGENINSIDAVIKGDNLTMSFNYKYITDCFQSIDADSVRFVFSDSNKPMIISAVSDKSFLYLVMPMNK